MGCGTNLLEVGEVLAAVDEGNSGSQRGDAGVRQDLEKEGGFEWKDGKFLR